MVEGYIWNTRRAIPRTGFPFSVNGVNFQCFAAVSAARHGRLKVFGFEKSLTLLPAWM
jgi:hypothetical protein